jgi:hypothetical protein
MIVVLEPPKNRNLSEHVVIGGVLGSGGDGTHDVNSLNPRHAQPEIPDHRRESWVGGLDFLRKLNQGHDPALKAKPFEEPASQQFVCRTAAALAVRARELDEEVTVWCLHEPRTGRAARGRSDAWVHRHRSDERPRLGPIRESPPLIAGHSAPAD